MRAALADHPVRVEVPGVDYRVVVSRPRHVVVHPANAVDDARLRPGVRDPQPEEIDRRRVGELCDRVAADAPAEDVEGALVVGEYLRNEPAEDVEDALVVPDGVRDIPPPSMLTREKERAVMSVTEPP